MTLLEEATNLINGQRKEDYGDAKASFERIAAFWSNYLGVPIGSQDVINMMALMKLARLAHTPSHRDSLADCVGYLLLSDRI